MSKIIFPILMFLLLAKPVSAAPPGVDITFDMIVLALIRFACWVATLGETLVVGAIVFYGIKVLLSRGNPQAFSEARKGLTWAIVGGLVVFGTWLIIVSVTSGVSSGAYIPTPFSCP